MGVRLAGEAARGNAGRLRDRIAELDAKRAETAEWLKRREEALRKADEVVVAIYSKMKPDAAAAQFSAMDQSGCVRRSPSRPRQAGIVLNEIDASRAARIAAEMAGVGQRREVARSRAMKQFAVVALMVAVAGCSRLKEVGQEPELTPIGSGL